jgi:sugar phosphate permease
MGKTEPLRPQAEDPGQERSCRPTRVRYQVLAFACSLALIAYVYRLAFAALGPDFKRDLHLDDQHLGYLLAAFLISYGGFEVPWGVLGDRLGVRHVLAVVSVTSALLTGAVALAVVLPGGWAAAFGLLLALRFLFGLFQAGLFPPLSRAMADWMPLQERGTAQGLIWMTSRLGGALAPLLLAPLVLSLGGWPQALVALTALGLL